MIYIVSGDGARCGSTMMMSALDAGGMDCVWGRAYDREVGLKEQYGAGFPDPEKYDGKVVKALPPPWGGGLKLIAGDYKVVWIHRPAIFRWKSFLKLQKRAYDVKTMADVHMELRTAFKQEGGDHRAVTINAEYCEARAKETLGVMGIRNDMDVLRIDYDDICSDPLNVFTWMQEEGWPIAPLAAAQIPRKVER